MIFQLATSRRLFLLSDHTLPLKKLYFAEQMREAKA